ncbi:MAG: hypothetical protein RLY14_151 [Planctomycetota bacterium]|jgi:CheY-like chemotaxis protein
MVKIVIDVGNCVPDHAAIKRLIEGKFDAKVLQAHGAEDALKLLSENSVALVLVNRKLDQDYTDGLEVIKEIKKQKEFGELPVMLITNYPEHQQLAIQEGARLGFGKLQLNDAATHQKLQEVLSV